MKKIILTQLFFFFAIALFAQEVVSTAGETQKISGIEISWSLGEPVIETVSNGSAVLTQGFHQSKLSVTAIDELLFPDSDLKVYPNPTSELVTIHFSAPKKNLVYSLSDLTGRMLESKTLSTTETNINLKKYASGTYLLKINDKNAQSLQSFKIIKK